MNTCKILMAIGGLGGGIEEEYFELGMQMGPDLIAADAGSTDSGPAYLANAMCKTSRHMLKHDLEIMVKGSREANIPIMIGSCGTCGSDSGVEEIAEIVTEILNEHGYHAKIAKVYSEVQRDLLKEKFAEGKIHALEGKEPSLYVAEVKVRGITKPEPLTEHITQMAGIVSAVAL